MLSGSPDYARVFRSPQLSHFSVLLQRDPEHELPQQSHTNAEKEEEAARRLYPRAAPQFPSVSLPAEI